MTPTDRNLAVARSEAAYTRSDRRYLCGGSAAHQRSVRAYNRTVRRYSRALCADALATATAEAAEARAIAQAAAAEAAAAEREANIETEGPMRLWQVTRTCHGGWDTYSRFVVAAPTADLARRVHPSDYDRWDTAQRCFVSIHDATPSEKEYGSWTDAIDTLEVIEIGAAVEGMESGKVLCASFHAG